MRIHRSALAPLAAALILSACAEDTTGPGVGSGTTLEATVDGQRLELNINTDPSTTYYDGSLHQAYFSGTLVGSPSRTILLGFRYDLDNGSFPQTVTGDAVNIVYTEIPAGGTALNYDCPATSSTCRITLTGSSGEIVSGTFSATLTEQNDPSKTVSITAGEFSVTLPRR